MNSITITRPIANFVVVVACGSTVGLTYGSDVIISGTVRDQSSQDPISGAMVSLQAAGVRTTTDVDGSYRLTIPDEVGLVIVAAKKSYFNRSTQYDGKPTGLDIDLDAVPQDDDPTYQLLPPDDCGMCHPHQLEQWLGSPMSNAGVNTWVHDIYSGTGTPDGMGGFVYINDSVHAKKNPNSECAACHQPENWIADPFTRLEGPTDNGYPSSAAMHGISCDVCHKIAHVNVSNINFPGLYPGSLTITRPQGPDYFQVEYGVLGDADFQYPDLMRASYQPQLVAEACGACHQDKNDPKGDGSFDGVISEPTYIEWAESPYGDIKSPMYATCVDCHMPPSGETHACEFIDLERDPETIRSHTILGTTPEYLENAVEMVLQTGLFDEELHVQVDVTNAYTGHHVPTGVTIRNMILLVEAWREENGLELEFTGDQVVHELGGVGDPAEGYYAGLPGKYYSKVNHGADGNGPVFFTDATGIQFDNRIPALETDTTLYTFAMPEGTGSLHVRARLIYRRSFRFLTDAKQWTEDGHGRPLEDVLPPHFGHLMEMAETVISSCPWDLDGDGDVGLSDLLELLAAWGPNPGHPADFDGDGSVGLSDLLAMLANWGLCP